MIKQANKILYVGAGCHIEPVTHFPETKSFIFIDSQPRSEFDSFHPKFDKDFYRPHFINDLMSTCQYYGFLFDSYTILDEKYSKKIINKTWYYTSWFYKIPNDINPTMLVFINNKTQQKLVYYISANIKFNTHKQILNDIRTCDGIIISGYFPEKEILQYFIKPKAFFGYTNTYYYIENNASNEEENTILYFLHNCVCNTQYYFTEFYMISNDSGVITKCQDFSHFLESIDYHTELVRRDIDDDITVDTDNSDV